MNLNAKLSARILTALSILYGITLGIVATLHPSSIVPVAVVGAMVLGGLWAVRGIFVARD
jgi:hypothetical protein